MMANTPNDAFALYLDGHSLRSVAGELRIGRATVERWSRRFGWVAQRRQAWIAATNTAADLQAEKLRIDRGLVGDKIFATLLDAVAQHRAFVEGRLPSCPNIQTAKL